MISGIDNISELFNIFHDGRILSQRFIGADNVLEVDIAYLAGIIAPGYTRFFILLKKTRDFSFTYWHDESENEKILYEPSKLFAEALHILSSETENGAVKLHISLSSELGSPSRGGILLFKADSVIVTDEGNKEYTLEALGSVCSQYWDNFGKRKNLKHTGFL